MEVIADAYENRLSLSSSDTFPESKYVPDSIIDYQINKSGAVTKTTSIVFALCNLLHFHETAKRELCDILVNNFPEVDPIINNLGVALSPAGINSGFLLLQLLLLLYYFIIY